jgi:hypothetical protein
LEKEEKYGIGNGTSRRYEDTKRCQNNRTRNISKAREQTRGKKKEKKNARELIHFGVTDDGVRNGAMG